MIGIGVVWYGTVRTVRLVLVWYGMIGIGVVWHGMIGIGVVWYGMIGIGVVWYDWYWCGMVWYDWYWCGTVMKVCYSPYIQKIWQLDLRFSGSLRSIWS
jgi:hypothetical protein